MTVVGAASAFRAITPIRILDTRSDAGIRRLWIESAFSIDPVTNTGVAAAAGVDPDDITAVVVNVTMVNAGGRAFGTVWPTGSERLLTSINNVEFEGHTRPNLVIAPLGLDRKISVFGSNTADVVLDVLGVFVASGPTTAGRFEPLGPTRAFDTRIARRRRVRRRLDADHRPDDGRRPRRRDRRRAERHRDQVPCSRQLPDLGRR